jgi:hypothetical protein
MKNAIKAINTLQIYSKYFDIWSLAGNSRASCRAHVMADLLGKDKVAQSKAGINAIRDEFYKQLNITGQTIAERDDNFINFCIANTSHSKEL